MISQKLPSKLLEEAVESIRSLPGVGERSALRLALHLLKQPSVNVKHFADSLVNMREGIRYCSSCNMICDESVCGICSDRSRDVRTICLVATISDVMSIERTGQYHGLYHVLGGIISPIDGIGPSDLAIPQLLDRIDSLLSQAEDTSRIELIMALPADVEGETTAFYIYRQIAPKGILVTSLARGLGVGDNLEYADELTLGRALSGRQEFRP